MVQVPFPDECLNLNNLPVPASPLHSLLHLSVETSGVGSRHYICRVQSPIPHNESGLREKALLFTSFCTEVFLFCLSMGFNSYFRSCWVSRTPFSPSFHHIIVLQHLDTKSQKGCFSASHHVPMFSKVMAVINFNRNHITKKHSYGY